MQAVAVLDYSQVYGRTTTWLDVQRAISRLDAFAVFGLASQWNAIIADTGNGSSARESVRIVRAIGEPQQLRAIQVASNRVVQTSDWTAPFPPPVVHRRQLLILMAEALKSRAWNPSSNKDVPGPELLDILLGINEHLEPPAARVAPTEFFAQMLAMADFYRGRSPEAGVTRMLRMVREIALQVSCSADVRALFHRATDLSLESYLSLAFAAYALTDQRLALREGRQAPVHGDTALPNLWPERLRGDSTVSFEEAQRFLEALSATQAEFAFRLSRAGPPQTDFSVFRTVPMLSVGKAPTGEAIHRVLDRTMVLEKVSDGPFWSTHDGARRAGVSIQDVNAAWGQLFEEYGHRLVENTPRQKEHYTRNPSFADTARGAEDSDGLLIEGDNWIFFEFKFAPLPLPARSGLDARRATKAILKRYGFPRGAAQLARLASGLAQGRRIGPQDHVSTTTFYPVLVAWDSIMSSPMINCILQRCFAKRITGADPRVRPLTVLSIEDLEGVLANTSRVTVSEQLARWQARDPTMRSSPAWVIDEEWPEVTPYSHPWVRELAERWRNEMVIHLFPDGETARRVKSGRRPPIPNTPQGE